MSVGYFELLGLPEWFALDKRDIENAYLERSKETHPDRFAGAPPAERVAAAQRAATLNEAYRTLRRPASRATYLLAQKGVTIGDHERVDDQTFLQTMLELREELADARAAGATAEVARLQQTMKAHHFSLVEGLAAQFNADDLEGVKRSLIELRFVDRYLEECDAALTEDED